MGSGLYDAAFATLGRLYGRDARSAITVLTLWGGFASTICWPLSAVLVESVGWRGTCFAYAAIHLLGTFPLHLFALPRENERPILREPDSNDPVVAATGTSRPRLTFLLLAAILTTGGAIAALISFHLITMLQGTGLTLAAAVSLGTLVGPAQVGARVVEMLAGRHYHPIWTLAAAALLITMGLTALWLQFPVPALALIGYGAGNGVWSIARGAVPLALFGPGGYAARMGMLAMPSLLAQAVAPLMGAVLMTAHGPEGTLTCLVALSAINILAIGLLWTASANLRQS
jgi:hypothetical protein